MIGRARLTYDKLTTMVIEGESVINSRPLTYIAPDDLDQALTPSHLLTGRQLLSLPDSVIYEEVDEDSALKYLNNRMVYFNRIMSNYCDEYLLELRLDEQ